MEIGPVYDGLVPLRYPYEVVGVDSGGDIVVYGLDVSFSSYRPGSCAEFWSAEVKILEERQYGSEACVV